MRQSGAVDVGALEQAVARIGYTIHAVDPARSGSPTWSATPGGDRPAGQALGAALLTLPVVLLGMFGPETMDPTAGPGWSEWAQLLLTAPVVFWYGLQFHRNAWLRLRAGGAGMDTLISVGTLAAFGYSVFAMLTGNHVFFETAAVIVTLAPGRPLPGGEGQGPGVGGGDPPARARRQTGQGPARRRAGDGRPAHPGARGPGGRARRREGPRRRPRWSTGILGGREHAHRGVDGDCPAAPATPSTAPRSTRRAPSRSR